MGAGPFHTTSVESDMMGVFIPQKLVDQPCLPVYHWHRQKILIIEKNCPVVPLLVISGENKNNFQLFIFPQKNYSALRFIFHCIDKVCLCVCVHSCLCMSISSCGSVLLGNVPGSARGSPSQPLWIADWREPMWWSCTGMHVCVYRGDASMHMCKYVWEACTCVFVPMHVCVDLYASFLFAWDWLQSECKVFLFHSL